MAQLYPVAGSKIFIGAAVTAKSNVTEADFASAVWTEIGGWTQAGALGDSVEVISQQVISDNRVRKIKGSADGGTMENTFLPDGTDPGQIAFLAAIDDCRPYQFKIEWGANCVPDGQPRPAGLTDMFYGLALPGARQGGAPNTAQLRTWSIAIDSNIVEE